MTALQTVIVAIAHLVGQYAQAIAHSVISRFDNLFVSRYKNALSRHSCLITLSFQRISPTLSHVMQSCIAVGTAMSMLASAPLPARASDETDSMINIWKTESSPLFGLQGTNLIWDIHVRNNSDLYPEGTPYNVGCREVRFFDLFSTSEPTFGTLPSRWEGNTNDKGDNLYDIVLIPTRTSAYIHPGEKKLYYSNTLPSHRRSKKS